MYSLPSCFSYPYSPPAFLVPILIFQIISFFFTSNKKTADCACCNGSYAENKVDIKNARVTKVERVENKELWEKYANKRNGLRDNARRKRYRNSVAAVPESSRPIRTDLANDERYLWHGTQQESLDKIGIGGFIISKDDTFRRYGNGAYFSDQSCKSHQYASFVPDEIGAGKTWTMLYCRVLPGKTMDIKPAKKLMITGAFNGMNALHPSDEVFRNTLIKSGRTAMAKQSFDSLVVRPSTRNKQVAQVHREFVIFNQFQVYPEFIVHYRFDTAEEHAVVLHSIAVEKLRMRNVRRAYRRALWMESEVQRLEAETRRTTRKMNQMMELLKLKTTTSKAETRKLALIVMVCVGVVGSVVASSFASLKEDWEEDFLGDVEKLIVKKYVLGKS